ncbi:MAG: hypothetical protein C4345_04995, partial [Chloroflexota bacterium]
MSAWTSFALLIIVAGVVTLAVIGIDAAFRRSGTRRALTYLFAALLVIWTFVPIYWLFNMSFMYKTELLSVPTHLFPHEPTFSNFVRIFGGSATGPNGEELLPVGQAPALKRGLVNSTVVALVVTALTVVVALPVSYALGRLSFRGRTPMLFAIIVSRSYPPISIVIPFSYLYIRWGLQGTLQGLILIYFTLT